MIGCTGSQHTTGATVVGFHEKVIVLARRDLCQAQQRGMLHTLGCRIYNEGVTHGETCGQFMGHGAVGARRPALNKLPVGTGPMGARTPAPNRPSVAG
jgi:hypothetical protein